jgi:predicted DsbA family dithiol-disulfide isomerase
MKVEIWSDVMCPFCYIGKRKFEKALEDFHGDEVQVNWRSFQLNPGLQTEPGKNIHQYLAEIKGISTTQAKQLNERVTKMAADAGLRYNFDTAVVANSFDAHRFSHLAKKHGLQDAAEERLFAAYFSEGKNTADHETLAELGVEIGLDRSEVLRMLESDEYGQQVEEDIIEAQRLGIHAVPFFVFDRKYAVSGAQPSEVFREVMETSLREANPLTTGIQEK